MFWCLSVLIENRLKDLQILWADIDIGDLVVNCETYIPNRSYEE
jgi:hypothetical protein